MDNPASLTPATPQDAALAQAVKTRLAAWGDPHVDSLPRTTAPGQTTGLPFDDGSRTTPARGAASRPDAQASTKTGCTLCGVAIDARNGNVRLSGKVRTSEQRAAAEDIARGIPGVRSVTNAIVVGP